MVTSIRQLGLDPDRFQLQAFLAAAGVSYHKNVSDCRLIKGQYVLAAVSNGLPDPPFIHQNWAAADFVVRKKHLSVLLRIDSAPSSLRISI